MKVLIRIGQVANDARIELDGVEVESVTAIAVRAEVGDVPRVTLSFIPSALEIVGEVDAAQVERVDPLSGEHKARHGCSGRPVLAQVQRAGNLYRAPCDTCAHPHHMRTRGG